MGLPGDDGEAFLLVGMDVLGDHPTGRTGPVETNERSVVVFGDGRELDPLAGSRVEKGPESGVGGVHGHGVCGLN